MDEQKFDDMLEQWARRAQASAPRLRPTPAMYAALNAGRRSSWFPVMARWVSVGAAAAVIVTIAALHPSLIPSRLFPGRAPTQDRVEDAQIIEAQDSEVVPIGELEPEMADKFFDQKDVPAPLPAETRGTRERRHVAPPPAPLAATELAAPAEPALSKQRVTPESDVSDALTDAETARSAAGAPRADALEFSAMRTAERAIGDKIFHLRGQVWIDAAYEATQERLVIRRGSRAYIDLLERLPGLRVYAEFGEHILISLKTVAVELGPDGRTALTDDDVRMLNAVEPNLR